jgi:hypothetical protein
MATFDLLDSPLVYIPVRWNAVTAGEDGSAAVVEHVVDIQVEMLDKDQLVEWIAIGNREVEKDGERARQIEAFRFVAKGWRKVVANGRAVEFDDANIWRLLTKPGFDTAFTTAYGEAINGRVEMREGNSESSPVDGRADASSGSTDASSTPPAAS